jgi:selenium-binding protein 1
MVLKSNPRLIYLARIQVHCLGSEIIISFLGNAKGEAPGGYLHLNKDFEIVGRWENSMGDIKFGYDFWYQPRHNVMVSSEWAGPQYVYARV